MKSRLTTYLLAMTLCLSHVALAEAGNVKGGYFFVPPADAVQAVDKNTPVQKPATDASARRSAAERYLKAAEYDALLDDFLNTVVTSTGAPPDAAAQAHTFADAMDMKALEQVLIDQMVANFTLKELNAMADFQESPEGKSINKKMPNFMGDMIQAAIPLFFQAIMKAGTIQPQPSTQPTDAAPSGQPEQNSHPDALPH